MTDKAVITLRAPDGKLFIVEQWESDKTPSDNGFRSDIEYFWTEGNYSCDCNRSLLTGNGPAPCGETWELVCLQFYGPT